MFSSYVKGDGLSHRTLTRMRTRYKDVEQAMSYTKDIALLLAFERASKVAQASEDMDDIIKFVDRFDDGGLLGIGNTESEVEVKATVKGHSKETQATLDLVFSALNTVKESEKVVDEDGES